MVCVIIFNDEIDFIVVAQMRQDDMEISAENQHSVN